MLSMEVSQTQTEIQSTTLGICQQLLERKKKQEIFIWLIFLISLGIAFSTYQATRKMRQEEEHSIQVLNMEIKIKRENENMLKKLGNVTYNEFPKNQHFYSPILSERLIKYYKDHNVESVADFGCGKCEYIININAAGFKARGFDGHPWNEDNNTLIKKLDLSQNVSLGQRFDYVQSFEVGQHIYSDFEDNFIYNVVNHARKGIILSWGIVGQIGYLHVNNRNNDYIIPKIEAHGFTFIKKDATLLREGYTNHFADTIMVFHKN